MKDHTIKSSSTAHQESHHSEYNDTHQPFFNPFSGFLSQGVVQKKGAPFFSNSIRLSTQIKNNAQSGFIQPMFKSRAGTVSEVSTHNEAVFAEHLWAILRAQNDSLAILNSFVFRVSQLADVIRLNGVKPNSAEEIELEKLYADFSALSFKSNPLLNEAWVRCIDSTRSVAAKSLYGKVGGKFRKKFAEVLGEIKAAHPILAPLISQIIILDVNKEHQLNKGLGGAQTDLENLMHAGVGEERLGTGSGTLSKLHKELHRLKSGGFQYDYNSVLPEIWDVIEEKQADYESDTDVKWK
jgi:hypothetical protein